LHHLEGFAQKSATNQQPQSNVIDRQSSAAPDAPTTTLIYLSSPLANPLEKTIPKTLSILCSMRLIDTAPVDMVYYGVYEH
jgi:hypothetical protein